MGRGGDLWANTTRLSSVSGERQFDVGDPDPCEGPFPEVSCGGPGVGTSAVALNGSGAATWTKTPSTSEIPKVRRSPRGWRAACRAPRKAKRSCRRDRDEQLEPCELALRTSVALRLGLVESPLDPMIDASKKGS